MNNIVELSEIARILDFHRNEDEKIVMTNGCFDILHLGHKRYLEKSKELGDILVVAINSDISVKALKGESRPINNQDDRAEMLTALKPVDYVIIFNELTAIEVLKEVRPDIYTKGGDYAADHQSEIAEKLPEYETLKDLGTELIVIELVEGKSTTNLIEKANSQS